MPTYTSISAAEYEPNAPGTSTLMDRLANNPVAMFEGASGAPRLNEDARAGSVAGDFTLFTAGGSFTHAGADASSPYVMVPRSDFRATTSCGLRCKATISAGTNGAEVRLLKNGTEVDSVTTGTLSADVTVVAGDALWFEVRAGTGGGGGETPGSVTVTTVGYFTSATRSCGGC